MLTLATFMDENISGAEVVAPLRSRVWWLLKLGFEPRQYAL